MTNIKLSGIKLSAISLSAMGLCLVGCAPVGHIPGSVALVDGKCVYQRHHKIVRVLPPEVIDGHKLCVENPQ